LRKIPQRVAENSAAALQPLYQSKPEALVKEKVMMREDGIALHLEGLIL
jgi:hypothetical protein